VPLLRSELAIARPDGWTINTLDDRLAIDTDHQPQQLPVDDIVAAARAAGVDLDTAHDRFGRNSS